MMRITLLLFVLIITTSVHAQIVRGITYTEDEISIQDKYVEAKKYFLIGRFEKAEEIYKQLYNEDRSNPMFALELSKTYYKLEDPYNEWKYAKTAYENGGDNEHIVLNFAEVCMSQEKYEEAIPPLTKLVSKNKASELYADKLATAHLQLNNAGEAIAIYNTLEEQIGINENVSRRKFEIFQILGKPKKALNELKQLSDAFPYNVQYLQNLASFYTKLGQEKKALDVYQKILDIDINDATANMAISASKIGEGGDENYLRSLTPIIENKSIPVDRKVLELIPYVQQMNEDYNQELADALILLSERITVIHPESAKSFALHGDVLSSAKRPKDAAKAYEKTLSLDDNNFMVWEGLMRSYYSIEAYENLLKVATDALDLFPNKASAYLYYGRANTMLNEYDEAIDLLNEGIFVSGKDVYHKSHMYAELGRAYAGKSEYENAQKNVQKALEISDNKNGLALEVMGDISYKMGNVDDAVGYWKKAQKSGIDTPSLINKIELKKL